MPGVRVADDLVAATSPPAPQRLWVADITYLRTWQGWLYLAAVQDLFAADRWLVDGRPHARRAGHRRAGDGARPPQARRRADPPFRPGLPIRRLAFGQQARDAGIAMSMGSKGDCFDNAVAESFFATLKKELVHRRSWPSSRAANRGLRLHRVFYNRERRHSTLGQRSPADYEKMPPPVIAKEQVA